MANKNSFDYEGSSFDNDLDFNDNAKPRSANTKIGKLREGVTEVASSGYDSFFNNFKDTDRWRQAVVDELPPQHKFVYDTYTTARRSGQELYDQISRETRPILGEISKKLNDMVSVDSRFKTLTQALENKFWTPPQYEQSDNSIMEEGLRNVMTETFGQLDMLQANREEKESKRRTAESITEQQIGQQQHEELLTALQPIQSSLSRLEMYKLQIESKFMKKQLELDFRMYMIQGRAYEHQQRSHLELMDQIKAVVANTGLPDFAKVHKTERFKEMLRDRAFDGIQNSLFGKDSAIGQMTAKIKRDIYNSAQRLTFSMQMAAMGLDQADMVFGKEAVMTPLESLGMIGGSEIGNFARGKIVKPLMDRLSKSERFQKGGYNAAQLMRDPRLLFDLLTNDPRYKEMVGSSKFGYNMENIVHQLKSYLNPEFNYGKFGGGVEGLNQTAIVTERVQRVQTDVVPGYLARILQQVTSFNTGAAAPMLVYDWGSNNFVERGGMKNKVGKILDKFNQTSEYTSSAKVKASNLLKDLGLEEGDRETLAAVLSMIARSKDVIKGGDLRDFREYGKASEAEKRILEKINSIAGFDKSQEESALMYRVRTAADELRTRGNNMSGLIQRLIDQGYGDMLVEDGLIEIDPKKPGAYRTVGSVLERKQREAIYYKEGEKKKEEPGVHADLIGDSDVNMKKRIKPFNKRQALEGIKKSTVKSWYYKGKNKRQIGPMAQDVQRNLGDAAAPDGTSIDLINMNGAAMAAIQQLAEDQKRLMNNTETTEWLKRIATALGINEKNKVADPELTLVDYAHLTNDQVAKTNYLLENNRFNITIPGIDFSKINMSMPDIDLNTIKENGKKFVDPLIKTGNKYIDGLQSVLFSAVKDGFEGGSKLFELGKENLKKGKKNFIDRPTGWLLDVLMRNEKEIKDKKEWLYKKSVEMAGKAIDVGISILSDKIPNSIRNSLNFVNRIKEGAKRLVNPPQDVYLKGSTEPVMQESRMRAGAYFDEEAKPIRGIDDLLSAKGSIRDALLDCVVLTETQRADGVYTQDGRLLKSTAGIFMGLANAAARGVGRAAMGFGKWLKDGPSILDKGKDAFNYVKSGIGKVFSGDWGLGMGTDPRLLRLTAQVRDLLAIGKSRKLVSEIYNRDLSKHPLEGKDFLSTLFGDKFVEKMGGILGGKEDAKGSGGGSSNGSGTTDVANPNAQGPEGGFMSNLGKAINGLDKKASAQDNIKGFLAAMGVKDPDRAVRTAKDAVTNAKGSKLFQWLKKQNDERLAEKEHEENFVGPKKKSLLKRLGEKSGEAFYNKTKGLRDRADQAKYNLQEQYHDFTMHGPRLPEAPEMVGPAPELVGPQRQRGYFGRMKDRLMGYNPVSTTLNTGRRAFLGAKRMGVGNIIGSALGGVGKFLFGSNPNDPQPTTMLPGAPIHKDVGARNHATVIDNKTGKATYYDADGDGMRDAGATKALVRQDEERRAQRQEENEKARESQERAAALLDERKKKDDDFLNKLLGMAGGLVSFLMSNVGGLLKGVGMLGKGVMAALGLGGKLLKGVGTGAMALGRAAVTGAKTSIATRGVLGAATAGLATIGTAAAATGGMIGTSVAALTFVARVALGPVGWGIAAAQAAWWVGKKIYGRVTRNDVDEFGRIRMYQYGLGDDEKELYHKVLSLEEYLKQHTGWQGDSPFINSRSVKTEEILEIFGCDKEDKEHAGRIAEWYENRFKPFYFNALAAVKYGNPKASLFEIKGFTGEQMEKFASKLEFPSGPYDQDISPIKELPSLNNNYQEVKVLVAEMKEKAKSKKSKDAAKKAVKATDSTVGGKDQDQKDDLAKKEKSANDELASAQADKVRAELQRKKLLADANNRQATENNAQNAFNAAQETKAATEAYRAQNQQMFNQRFGGQGVSEDGGRSPIMPVAFTNPSGGSTPSVTGIPMAQGQIADPSSGASAVNAGKGVDLEGLNPEVLKALYSMAAEFMEKTGKRLNVGDGKRNSEKQARLYATLPKGKAAPPGSSMHEFGAAVDISSQDAALLEKMGLMRKYGFTRPIAGETWHIEPAGIQGQLDKARKDPAFISAMMRASYGRGGGGIATLSGIQRYSRNDAYAMKLFNEGSSVNPSDETANQESSQGNQRPMPLRPANDDQYAAKPTLASFTPTTGTAPTMFSNAKPGIQNAFYTPNANQTPGPNQGVSEDGGKQPPTSKGVGTGKPGSTEEYKELIGKYAKEAGVNPAILQVFAGIESSMGKNTNSGGSAKGPFQFMPATWREQMGKHASKYGLDMNTSSNDLRASALMTGEYYKTNEAAVKAIRQDRFDIVDAYMTHMLGGGGSKTFAKLPDDAIAAQALGNQATSNPNVFYDKGRPLTVGEVRAKQMEKINRVAQEYNIDLSGLASKFASNPNGAGSGFSPVRPQLARGELGNDTGGTAPVYTNGPKTAKAPQRVEEEQLRENVRQERSTLAIQASYTPPTREVTRPARQPVEVDQRGVSGITTMEKAFSSNNEAMTKLVLVNEEQRDLLIKVDQSLLRMLKVMEGNGGGSGGGGGGGAGAPKSPTSQNMQRPVASITPRTSLDTRREYG